MHQTKICIYFTCLRNSFSLISEYNSHCRMKWVSSSTPWLLQNLVRRGQEVRVSDLKSLGPSPLWVRALQGVRTLYVRKPSGWLAIGQWFYPVVRLCNSDGFLGSSSTWFSRTSRNDCNTVEVT